MDAQCKHMPLPGQIAKWQYIFIGNVLELRNAKTIEHIHYRSDHMNGFVNALLYADVIDSNAFCNLHDLVSNAAHYARMDSITFRGMDVSDEHTDADQLPF